MRDELPSFEQTKKQVLKALYYFIHESDAEEWLEVIAIQEIVGNQYSAVFLRRVLESLEADGFTESRVNRLQKVTRFTITSYGIQQAEEQIAEAGSSGPIERIIPAADRTVSLNHNDPAYLEVKGAISELRQQLSSSNDLGDMNADDLIAVTAELDQINGLFDSDVVRPSVVVQAARKALKWIADKSAGAAVGKAAIALLHLIATFFNVNL